MVVVKFSWLILFGLLICLATPTFASGYGDATDGNLFFSTSTKTYGYLTTPADYNVVGNTLYLKLNRVYDFNSFYLGAGTKLTTTDVNGVALYINSTGQIRVDGNIDLNGILLDGNVVVSSWNGISFARVERGGAGGASGDIVAEQGNGFGGGGHSAGYCFSSCPNQRGRSGGSPIGTTGAVVNLTLNANGSLSGYSAPTGYSVGANGSASIYMDACSGSCTLSVTSGSGGTNYGGNGGNGDYSASGTFGFSVYAGGGGGAGGIAGKAAPHLYLNGETLTITGKIDTSGTNGGNGGNGGTGKISSGVHESMRGSGGGGGGGGNAGNIYLNYISSSNFIGSQFIQNKGLGGTGGSGSTYGSAIQANNGSDGSNGILYFNSATDATPPTTTLDYIIPDNNNIATITITCVDTFSGCALTQYRINSGAWQTYTAPFTYPITATTTIDYNSTDNTGNIEITKTTTINTVSYITIKRPKDELTNAIIDANYNVILSGSSSMVDLNLATDKNYYVKSNVNVAITSNKTLTGTTTLQYYQRNYTTNISSDTNTYVLQPYLLDKTDSSLYQLITQTKSRNALSNISIFIYKTIDGNLTLVTSGTTDVTGIASFYLNNLTTYYIRMYSGTTLVYSSDNFTPIASPTYFNFDIESTNVKPLDVNALKVVWTPSAEYLYTDATQLTQSVTGENIASISAIIYDYNVQGDFNAGYRVIYGVSTACSGNTCSLTENFSFFDINSSKPFYVDFYVTLSDGNWAIFTHRYYKGSTSNLNLFELMRNVRTDFGCSKDASKPCGGTMILSIILVIIALGGLAFKFGFVNQGGIGIIALGLLGLFTYVGWFFWIIYAAIVILVLFGLYRGVGD